ncbi:MAG: DUF1850 domain-containing protein [Verrucomicrobiota bacterium]
MFFAPTVRLQGLLLWSAALAGILLAGTFPAVAGGWELAVDGAGASRKFPLPGGTFELSWIHSVELTEWRESYAVTRTGEIVLVASEFASGGAGLPDTVRNGETFRSEGGRMRIEGRNVRVRELKVRLSDVSHHVLWLGEQRVDLNAAFGEGVVTIHAVP